MSAGRIGHNHSMPQAPGLPQAPAGGAKGLEEEGVKDIAGGGPATAAKGLGGLAGMPDGMEGPDGTPNSRDASVQISDGARTRAEGHKKALHIARSTPDIREDRVASLKKQIDEGSYKPDAGKIADGMLREAIKDHLSEDQA